jgi:Holliday junction resolvase RusA-like endonuclease
MRKTEVFFPIPPRPKARPRFTRYGHAYTPNETLEYEEKVRNYYVATTSDYYEGAIRIELTFYMPIPKSASKKNKRLMVENVIKHVKKPDTDNMVKALLDSINKIAYKDDSQITQLISRKRYATDGNVGIYMVITEDVE